MILFSISNKLFLNLFISELCSNLIYFQSKISDIFFKLSSFNLLIT